MAQSHDNCFDFLRFLFAFIVMLGHLVFISQLPALQPLLPIFNTYISITGFFVISGFLITQSYIRSSSLNSYFLKRAKRLLPAYLLVIFGCAIGLVFLSEYNAVTYFTNPQLGKYLLANLTFLNFVQPCLPGVFESDVFDCSVNPALWTLKIEVAFYLCVPLIIWLVRKTKYSWSVLLGIYLFSVCYRNGLNWYGDYSERYIFVILARQLPGFLSYFSVGMLMCLYKDWFLQYKNKIILPAIAIVVLEWCLDMEWFLPLAFGIMVLWCAYSLPKLNDFARWGDISYGIYIYHSPMIKILYTIGFFAAMNVWVASGLFILIVVSLALISWHGMEKRVLKRHHS